MLDYSQHSRGRANARYQVLLQVQAAPQRQVLELEVRIPGMQPATINGLVAQMIARLVAEADAINPELQGSVSLNWSKDGIRFEQLRYRRDRALGNGS